MKSKVLEWSVSDCSVGKIESQVGEIALQVGIEIFWIFKRSESSTRRNAIGTRRKN
jgi:hypothetical protein